MLEHLISIGFVLIVHPADEEQVVQILQAQNEVPLRLGRVIPGKGVNYL